MKRILFFLFVFLAIKNSGAQSLSPEIISSAGNSFIVGTSQLDWTLGEPVTSTLINGSDVLTQGFHQDNLTVTSVDNSNASYGYTVFPNPAMDFIRISFEKANDNNVIELYSSDGKLLLSQTSNSNSLSQIDMSSYDSGTYLLKIRNADTKGKSYRIIKLK